MPTDMSAEQFIERLEAFGSPEALAQMKADEGEYGTGDVFIGVRPGQIFTLAKEFIEMPLEDIETLLQSPIHEVRAGALSIMGHQAMRKKTPQNRKKELFDLYLKHMDRINSWPLVDISCHKVIGGYLLDKPRDVLYTLARSENWCERRAAVYSTLLFMRGGDLDDAFKISEILLYDDQHFIHTAVGGVLREAGKQDRSRLLSILDQHAATMPRVALRYAIEHLDKEQRDHYLHLKKRP
jgi:3-methyladenine DNA glycosylase AlkD